MNNKGLIVEDYLITLLLMSVSLSIIVSVFSIIIKYDFFNELVQDEIMIYQLRRDLLISYNYNMSNNCLSFEKNGKKWKLYYVNNKLILTPGVQVILDNIETLEFSIENDFLYLNYIRNNKLYSKVIMPYD